ncbi:MAG TPA: c-type cytochrome [Polyangiaceae bacterium]
MASIVALSAALLARYAANGGMTARRRPSSFEASVAGWLVDLGVGKADRARPNPVNGGPDSADVSLGRDLYRAHCQACHGADGQGKTAAGEGLYPPPADLRRAALEARKRTDGELFYFVRNGVRDTGMPAWPWSDTQIWEVVAFVRQLPPSAGAERPRRTGAPRPSAYVGSAACGACHAAIYERWAKTPMANVVRDPREHPEAIVGDFADGDPLVDFRPEDVALVYGSLWKQRYFKKVGNDYFVFPAQWDVVHEKWRPYFAKDDWWAPLYPPDNFQRPTGPLCDGCHSVHYDVATNTVTEWNVGCERCHGPGGAHAKTGAAEDIVDPARLGYVAANDVCIQCHSQGRPVQSTIGGRAYDWPVGYEVPGRLSDVWRLEEHRLGETTFTHFADGTAHKNRMQGNDFVTSAMYTHRVTCFSCHDVHGTEHPANLRKAAGDVCLDCHGPSSPNGPHARTLEEHTHHEPGSEGSACIACHMPKIAQTIGDVNVRSHTFRFVPPSETDRDHVPNACNVCHADRTARWATDALASWEERSPWRAGM